MTIPLINPHAFLGLHPHPQRQCKLVRLWRPGATELYIELFGNIVKMVRYHSGGLFEALVPEETGAQDYRIYHSNGALAHDPYAFLPTFRAMDEYLYGRGVHYRLHEVMGAHVTTQQGVQGVSFSVWAPEAAHVSLIADFNLWDGRVNPMRRLGASGVWELFVPGIGEGMRYKYELYERNGTRHLRADPFAFASELRPKTASVIWNVDDVQWTDQEWMEKRPGPEGPMTIYEVHLGSWQRGLGGEFLNYRILAQRLASYCKEMGFTHVELLPVAEHPLDESWGYQVTGFFAATSRFGTPRDFQAFVNILHSHGIGVFLDWVPAHFPRDDWALARFDGSNLYEHLDERQGAHPHWQTAIFNYGRNEVSNFLIASALFWLQKMHIDGLRVDAVASMLYLDYGRSSGEWIPNSYGGKENLEAIEFLKHLNSIVHTYCPGALMIAEESTSFYGISHPLNASGLGFDLKWNMGWMHDTLFYNSLNTFFRSHHQNQLTFSLLYAYSERFILALSHDEVVHGKRSLLGKMPGDCWQQFANLRLLYGYMICHPGKKLLFMGGEWGQGAEWNCNAALDWQQLDLSWHVGVHRCVRALNHFYLEHAELWAIDFDWAGFEWVDFSDCRNSVIAYLRKSERGALLCVHNFTPQTHFDYRLPFNASVREVFNTDREAFGGSGVTSGKIRREDHYLILELAPLATQIFLVEGG